MKRAGRWGKGLFLLVVIQSMFLLQAWRTEEALGSDAQQTAGAGYLENVSFEKLPGRERVKFSFSTYTAAAVESQTGNEIALRLDNVFVPEGLRRSLGETELANVIRVTPVQKTDRGRPWATATISLRRMAPFSIRQEGLAVLVDFNVASLGESPAKEREQAETDGSRISLDFQKADIKSVFRLLAELGGKSIVYGTDIKGDVTVHMENIPWEQALDTILKIQGLGKSQEGNVITVMTQDKIKKDEEAAAKLAAEPFVTRVINIDYADAKKLTENLMDLLPKDKDGKTMGSVKVDEHSNALIIQATRQDMTRLFPVIDKIDKPTPQILIKANIIETTKDTARNLGIQWGGMYGRKIGSQGLYVTPGGAGGTAAAPGSAFSGQYDPTSGAAGISGQGFGINFPAAMTATASASLGLMFGTIGENILDLQLNALQEDGKLNILSSPSITTMDNQKAFTENGEKVPYVTTDNSGGVTTKTVKFENAVLRLEITPHVIDGKNLKMKIMVQKDEVDSSRSVDGNPYIIKKQTETNLIVQDGETIVISGLTKKKNMDNVNGVPWLKDVPVLGWLFKGEGKSESMEEVLIFITSNILKPPVATGIQGKL